MVVVAAEFGQAQAVSFNQADARFFGALHKLLHTRVAAAGVDQDFLHRLRRDFDAHADGMKAKENFAGRSHFLYCFWHFRPSKLPGQLSFLMRFEWYLLPRVWPVLRGGLEQRPHIDGIKAVLCAAKIAADFDLALLCQYVLCFACT